MVRYLLISVILLSNFLLTCSPPKDNVKDWKGKINSTIKVYEVEGEGEEYFEARRNAIANGVRKSIIDIIGEEKFNINREILREKVLENKKLISGIFEFSSTDILNRGNKKVVKGIVKVNVDALKNYLNEIQLGKSQTQTSKEIPNEKDTVTGENGKTYQEVFSPKDNSPIYNISFLVFVPNDKISKLKEDEDYKLFIETINSKLSFYGLDYIDFNRVMNLSKKFEALYEEKSGEAMSLSQKLAQDLKANVYIEADINTTYNFVSGNNVDIVVNGSIKAYDSSTGKGLGSTIFSKNKKSNKGIFVAKTKAISEIVDNELPKLLKTLEEYFSKGVKIEVNIIGFSDILEEKDFITIIDSLPGIETKKRKSISGNMSTYEIVYKSGSSQFIDDLIEVISNHPKYSKITIDQAANKVIIKLK